MAAAGVRTRALAAEIVDDVVTKGRSLDAAIADKESRLAPQDRPLLRMLAFGVLRNHWRLQSWVAALVDRPFRKRDRVLNALLAIGLYQLADLRVPDHAAVSQTVEAARVLRRPKLAGLVNACLRRFQREGPGTVSGDEATWNHPGWLIEQLRRDWPEDAAAIMTANNERAPMWLRVNAARATADDYRERLAADGIDATPLEGVPDALRLAEPRPVDELPGFADGDVSVQDAAAQIAARWLMADGPRRVLDACAAPGARAGICWSSAARRWNSRLSTAMPIDWRVCATTTPGWAPLQPSSTPMHQNQKSGGMARTSMRSCSMRRARRRASFAATRISSCCDGPRISLNSAPCRRPS